MLCVPDMNLSQWLASRSISKYCGPIMCPLLSCFQGHLGNSRDLIHFWSLWTTEFVWFPRSIKLWNWLYDHNLKIQGHICCCCLWFRRSPGMFCETLDLMRSSGRGRCSASTMGCFHMRKRVRKRRRPVTVFLHLLESPEHFLWTCYRSSDWYFSSSNQSLKSR